MPPRTLRRASSLAAASLLACILPACGSSGEKSSAAPGKQSAQRSASSASQPQAPAPPAELSLDAVSISALREDAIAVIERLSQSQNPSVRANAVEAASEAPRRLSAIIEAGLIDRSPAVRSVACIIAGKHAFHSRIGVIRQLRADSNPFVRISALYALARLESGADISPIAASLLSDPSLRVRSHAAFVLGELNDRSAVPLLKEAAGARIRGQKPEDIKIFQLQVAEALAKLGEDDQREVLRAALYPARPEELEAAALAAQTLGQLNDRESIDQLANLSEFVDPKGRVYPAEVRLTIAASLAGMGLRGGEFIADQYAANPNAPVRALVAVVYGQFGSPLTLAHVRRMMTDDDSEQVRIAAAWALLKALNRRSGQAL